MPKETEERDDIGRMLELNSRFEPDPGSAFKETLAELRRQHGSAGLAMPPKKSAWNRLVVAGLSLAAALAVIFITLSLFAVFDKSNSPTIAPVAQIATATVGQPTATTTPAKTIDAQSASPETVATTVATVENTLAPTSTETPATIAPTSAPASQPSPTEPVRTTAATTRAVPAINKPPATLASAGSNRITPAVSTVSGTVTAFNQAAKVLQLTDLSGKSVMVKLVSATVIIRSGQPINSSEIKVGDKLTASGKPDAQGQFEASSIALDIINQPRPIGDPGYPDEKK
jgi:cytoskeletal protein RodZ